MSATSSGGDDRCERLCVEARVADERDLDVDVDVDDMSDDLPLAVFRLDMERFPANPVGQLGWPKVDHA